LSSTLRGFSANASGGEKWIVMDGHITPDWVENLNSAMDDNQVLTLASQERIYVERNSRFIFECTHLEHATPATVSRASIVFMNQNDSGWEVFFQSWLGTIPPVIIIITPFTTLHPS
jgi:dynein heavy chain